MNKTSSSADFFLGLIVKKMIVHFFASLFTRLYQAFMKFGNRFHFTKRDYYRFSQMISQFAVPMLYLAFTYTRVPFMINRGIFTFKKVEKELLHDHRH